jgi:hypothetical protein
MAQKTTKTTSDPVEKIQTDVLNPAKPGQVLVQSMADPAKERPAPSRAALEVVSDETLPDVTLEEYKVILGSAKAGAKPTSALVKLLRENGYGPDDRPAERVP